jgi:hypothetical protein
VEVSQYLDGAVLDNFADAAETLVPLDVEATHLKTASLSVTVKELYGLEILSLTV